MPDKRPVGVPWLDLMDDLISDLEDHQACDEIKSMGENLINGWVDDAESDRQRAAAWRAIRHLMGELPPEWRDRLLALREEEYAGLLEDWQHDLLVGYHHVTERMEDCRPSERADLEGRLATIRAAGVATGVVVPG
jgi:hypothetical protein